MGDLSENVSKTIISSDTRELLKVRAKLSEFYKDLSNILGRIDPREEIDKTQELKQILLEADNKLFQYIAFKIDENILSSDYLLM